eukprot:3156571-Pleurochrysis_carterae.AAC.6
MSSCVGLCCVTLACWLHSIKPLQNTGAGVQGGGEQSSRAGCGTMLRRRGGLGQQWDAHSEAVAFRSHVKSAQLACGALGG